MQDVFEQKRADSNKLKPRVADQQQNAVIPRILNLTECCVTGGDVQLCDRGSDVQLCDRGSDVQLCDRGSDVQLCDSGSD